MRRVIHVRWLQQSSPPPLSCFMLNTSSQINNTMSSKKMKIWKFEDDLETARQASCFFLHLKSIWAVSCIVTNCVVFCFCWSHVKFLIQLNFFICSAQMFCLVRLHMVTKWACLCCTMVKTVHTNTLSLANKHIVTHELPVSNKMNITQ
jgi:hypothetical protein